METIRDSAFGKMVRICSNRRLLQYPEEIGSSGWKMCLKPERRVGDEEATTRTEPDEDPDTWGLYTVLSQASRLSHHATSQRGRTISQEPEHPRQSPTEKVILVDWRGPSDSEVRATCYTFPIKYTLP